MAPHTPHNKYDKEAYKSTERKQSFDHEYHGKTVKITLHNGSTIIGKAESAQYWLKIKTPGDKVIYVNKAYIAMIEPLEG